VSLRKVVVLTIVAIVIVVLIGLSIPYMMYLQKLRERQTLVQRSINATKISLAVRNVSIATMYTKNNTVVVRVDIILENAGDVLLHVTKIYIDRSTYSVNLNLSIPPRKTVKHTLYIKIGNISYNDYKEYWSSGSQHIVVIEYYTIASPDTINEVHIKAIVKS